MKRGLALFDFDGTLLSGDSIVAFVGYARKRGALSRGEYIRVVGATALYLLRRLTDAQIKTRSLRFLHGLAPEEQRALAADFVRESLLPRVYPAGQEEIQRHRREGRITLLVSASTDNYMPFVAEALGFDGLLCTPLEPDGTVKDNCKGEEKPRRVREWLQRAGVEADWADSWAYGDSPSDVPMMALCGHAVLVNPKAALRRSVPQGQAVTWR